MKTLDDWLAHAERLHPKNIELGPRPRPRGGRSAWAWPSTARSSPWPAPTARARPAPCSKSILTHAGYRTAVFTSPHLVRFEERLRLSRRERSKAQALAPHFEQVEAAPRRRRADLLRIHHAGDPALHGRSRSPTSAILEVGLGGRLDAVNIVDADCAVITSIDLDHMDFLGPRPREHRLREGRHPARRPAGDRQRPGAAAERDRPRRGDRRRPLARRPRLQRARATSSNGAGAGRGRRYSGLAYPALRGANQLINAAGRAGGARVAAPAAADHRPGGAQRAGDGRTARALPDRAGRAGAGAGRRAQPARGGGAGREPRRDGLLSDHACACSASWPTRTWRPCSRASGR